MLLLYILYIYIYKHVYNIYLSGFLKFICSNTEEKWLPNVLIFMPYLDSRFVEL